MAGALFLGMVFADVLEFVSHQVKVDSEFRFDLILPAFSKGAVGMVALSGRYFEAS